MEVLTLQVIRAPCLPEPHRQYPVTIRGHHFRLDLAYPHRMIAIEYDSDSHHNGELQRQRDRWRQNLITSEGWRFVLVDKAQLQPGRHTFIATLSRLLGCDQQGFPNEARNPGPDRESLVETGLGGVG
ncbi:MAG: hypothetical protein ACRDKZ_02520 [Actinomycetota bacterium]